MYRLRHNAFAGLVLKAVLAALRAQDGAAGRYEMITERALCTVALNQLKPSYRDLRPDAYLVDRATHTLTPIEFTVPDDAGIAAAVDKKHGKYLEPLRGAVPGGPSFPEPGFTFRPLVVVAVGVWGTVHQSTMASLVRLGLPPDSVPPLLRRVVPLLMRHNVVISRVRFAAASRWIPQSV